MPLLSSIIPPVNVANASGVLPVGSGGTGVTTSTGSGSVVRSNSPALVTPALGAATATSLTASGVIESTSGGFKFPNGTTQTVAAIGIQTGYVVSTPLTLAAPDWLPTNGGVYLKSSYSALATALGSLANSTSFTTWTSRTIPSGTYNAVAYLNGLFVAVGTFGRISTSPDGVTWTARTSGTTDELSYVTYGAGLYVVLAKTGRFLTSPDAITWTARSSLNTTTYGLTFGNSLFVALTGSAIFTSPDAITWTSRGNPINPSNTSGPRSVAFGNGVFVVVGTVASGANTNTATSSDGITWTARNASGYPNSLLKVVYGNGRFVALGGGNNNTNPGLSTTVNPISSPDGVFWPGASAAATTANAYVGTPDSLAFAANTFVFASDGDTVEFLSFGSLSSSFDGSPASWRSVGTIPFYSNNRGLAYANGLLVLVGSSSLAATSPLGYDTSTSFCTPTYYTTGGLNSFIKA